MPTTDPRFIQSNSQVGLLACAFPVNVVAGDVIIVNASWFTGAFTGISDSLGTVYTAVPGFPAVGGGLNLGLWVGRATSSGPNTVTVAVTSATDPNIQIAEIRNVSTVVDVATHQSFGGTPSGVTSGDITTTFNREFLFAAAAGFRSAGVFLPTNGFMGIGWGNGDDSAASAFLISGAPGVYNATFSNLNNDQGLLGIFALKSNTGVAITSPAALPDGGLGGAYDYTLTAVGGSAPYNWTIISGTLPFGLSLNATTGRISGTAGASILANLVVSCDGGTTLAITIKIVGTLPTIAHVQDTQSSESGAFPANVTAGNLIVVGVCVTPGSSTAVPRVTDTLGTDYYLLGVVQMGNGSFGAARYSMAYAGIAPSSGFCQVSAATAAMITAAEFSNAQLFLDNISLNYGTSGTTITNSMNPLAANELFVSMAVGFSGASALTVGAPFTHIARTHAQGSQDWALEAGIVTDTVSYGLTGNSDGQWGIVLAGFRPGGGTVLPPVVPPRGTGCDVDRNKNAFLLIEKLPQANQTYQMKAVNYSDAYYNHDGDYDVTGTGGFETGGEGGTGTIGFGTSFGIFGG